MTPNTNLDYSPLLSCLPSSLISPSASAKDFRTGCAVKFQFSCHQKSKQLTRFRPNFIFLSLNFVRLTQKLK
jgi:hypothetical protein